MKICPSCGRPESPKLKFVHSFCEECHFEHHKLYDAPALLDVDQCQNCRRVRLSGEWKNFSNDELLKWIVGKIKTPHKMKGATLKLEEVMAEEGKRNYNAAIDAEFDAEGVRVKRRIIIHLRVASTQCRECSLRSGGYFEAVIQLRGDRGKIEKIAGRLNHRIEKEKGFVSKVEERKEGIDIYVSSKEACHKAIHWLKLHANTSRTLAGKREGKELYRTTYCIRLEPPKPTPEEEQKENGNLEPRNCEEEREEEDNAEE